MSTTVHLLDADTVRFERLLPGPIERVWDHLTRPELRRTWLTEEADGDITASQPPQSLELALHDSSVVRFELEPRGEDVLLVLTHRRLPACLVGVCTTLLAALVFFLWDQPAARPPQPNTMGIAKVHLKFRSFAARPQYGMLGGRC
jgi:hypothetical protein